ncbi:MAG: hypothetical protein DMF49_05210 [Acidobacteria bacterium]|nr:MAG: hypothetical protein DMF49_05210 [Acidobacteriota bacterium]
MSRLLLLRIATLPFETLSGLRSEKCAASVEKLLYLEETLAREVAGLEDDLHAAAGSREQAADPDRARARLAVLRLRRDAHNRRPLRSEDKDTARMLLTREAAASLERYEGARSRSGSLLDWCRREHETELVRTRRALLCLAADSLCEEGVRLASRSLLLQIRSLARTDPARWGHDERHVASKIASYAARFCTKTSPNSVFCATGIAEAGPGAARVGGEARIRKVDTILSVAEARKIAECLAIEGSTLPVVIPRPNPTLREEREGWTWWKPASLRNPDDDEVLSRTKDHPVLRALLEEAGQGALHAPELLRSVAGRCGVDAAALTQFYRQAVERGILIAEVEIAYNSRRPLRDIASAWRRAGCHAPWLSTVEEAEAAVDTLPSLESSARIEFLDRIGNLLERLPRFITRFLDRFGPDAEVEFLDFYHDFVEKDEARRPLAFPEPSGVEGPGSELEQARSAKRRLSEWFATRALETAPGEEVQIDEDQVRSLVDGLPLPSSPMPRWACGVLFQIASRGAADIERGNYRLVLNALFNGIGLALARFAHLHGDGAPPENNPIVRELRRHCSTLEEPGAVVAEMTYNHIARTANAGLRPSIFRHEIELPGDKASEGAEVIPLRDLVLRYNAAQDRLGLFWRSRGVAVIPVISSGVNPQGIVSFLVSIGQQDLQYIGYLPGFEVEGVKRWPRFVSGRLVLFRARWIFGPGEWPSPADLADHFIEAARWRRSHGLPRHVFILTSSDPKPRYVDLESPPLVDLLRRATVSLEEKPGASLYVTEMLPGPDELWIERMREAGKEHFASEFLVQMQNPEPA